MGGGKAAAQWILTQPAKFLQERLLMLLPLLLPLLPTLLLLKPLLLLLTSQMATGKGPGPQWAQGGPGGARGALGGPGGPWGPQGAPGPPWGPMGPHGPRALRCGVPQLGALNLQTEACTVPQTGGR